MTARAERPAGRQRTGARASRVPLSSIAPLWGAISRSRIERVASQATGVFGFVFAIQSLPALFDSVGYLRPVWAIAMPAVLFATILAVVVTAFAGRGVNLACGVMALTFLLSLILWPASVASLSMAEGMQPWLWYLPTVGMACAAISFSVWLAGIYIVGVPLAYAIVRVLPAGGGASPGLASLDAIYVLILGASTLIIITTLRHAADRVDRAQQAAMLRYSVAVKHDAAEAERLSVDALVHDRVLTTLLTAAKSGSVMERDLAVSMAEGALDTLQSAEVTVDDTLEVDLADLALRLADAAKVLSPGIRFTEQDAGSRKIPGDVAEAAFSAAVQAIVNSLQHAAPGGISVDRTLSVHGDSSGFTVQVSDNGVGFLVDEVPYERLGLRVSIRERVASVGGVVHVQSIVGSGTSVVIVWPDPARPSRLAARAALFAESAAVDEGER